MPTILVIGPYAFRFFALDLTKPRHIHAVHHVRLVNNREDTPREIPDIDRLVDVQVDDVKLHVTLADGRKLDVPLAHLPLLAQATAAQRQHWEFFGENEVIFWPDVDEGVEIAHLLGMTIAP